MTKSGLNGRRIYGACALMFTGLAGAILGIVGLEPPADLLKEAPLSAETFKTLSIIQSGVLVIAGVAAGYFLTPRLGLTSIIVDGRPTFQISILWFVFIGAVAGLGIWALDAVLTAHWPALASFHTQNAAELAEMETHASAVTRLAYGGVVEEILARYGVMSGLALMFLSTLKNKALALGLAIFTSSVLFGVGHLPAVFAFVADPPTAFLIKVVALNTLAAAVFASAFTAHSLEAAMLSHIGFHLGLMVLS
ncbi:MAG: CPBP family glutamic-type intramembrane protease [Pseudomonadota bacterium]